MSAQCVMALTAIRAKKKATDNKDIQAATTSLLLLFPSTNIKWRSNDPNILLIYVYVCILSPSWKINKMEGEEGEERQREMKKWLLRAHPYYFYFWLNIPADDERFNFHSIHDWITLSRMHRCSTGRQIIYVTFVRISQETKKKKKALCILT